MTDDLSRKRCVPCEGGTPLSREASIALHAQVPTWVLAADAGSIAKEFTFTEFKEAMGFVNEVADIAEFEGHHPDIAVSWNKVRLTLSTHAVKGLSENDFILAAKIDAIDPA